jgi:hypothetical protein
MITDYCSKAVKRRAKETTIEQDTPQDKERLKITPTIQENQDKERHRRATTNHRKAIPKEHEWDYQEEPIEGYDGDENAVLKCYDGDEASCFCFRDALRHRFTSPEVCMAEWMSIQQNNTRCCVNQRTMITNATVGL